MAKTIEINDKVWKNKPLNELKKHVKEYYLKNLKGKSVVNKDRGITVKFGRKGIEHLLYARKGGYEKYIVILTLKKMVQYAEFLNFKDREIKDPANIIGYMNFKINVKISNKLHWFRIVIRITKDGNFYYDHSVKIKRKLSKKR